MKAWAIERYAGRAGDLSSVTLRDVADPAAGPGQVLVRVRGAAVNPADIKVFTGANGGRFLHASRFPLVLGFDFAGVIEAIGGDVRELAVGDEVYGHLPYSRKNHQGTFGELVAVDADSVGPRPSSRSFPEAACAATAGLTALQGLRDKGRLKAGDKVLVNGASGGVGSFAVQIAKHRGAEVWGTCSASNRERVLALGADRAIDYRETPIGSIDARFDIVYDVAASSSYGRCAGIVAESGAYITLLPTPSLVTGKLRALFSKRSCAFVVVNSKRADLAELATLIDEGAVQVPVEASYEFDDVPAALARLRDGGVQGKLAVAGAPSTD